MSAAKQLQAVARDRVGKGAARAVRREGRIPAVIYGAGQPAQPIALDHNQAKQLIFAGHFLTTIFEIEVGGQKTRVLPRDYQLDPVKDHPVHIDFLRITKDAMVTVEIPVHFLNQDISPGMKKGGVLNIVRHAVELTLPVDRIPEALDVDLAEVDIGDSIHISAIKLPEGARPTIADRDFTVATIAAPTKIVEEVAAAGEVAAPAAEAGAKAAPAKAAEKSDKKG
jgi:large subunit ribosomal protein L25